VKQPVCANAQITLSVSGVVLQSTLPGIVAMGRDRISIVASIVKNRGDQRRSSTFEFKTRRQSFETEYCLCRRNLFMRVLSHHHQVGESREIKAIEARVSVPATRMGRTNAAHDSFLCREARERQKAPFAPSMDVIQIVNRRIP
jgi:hypothetical protein